MAARKKDLLLELKGPNAQKAITAIIKANNCDGYTLASLKKWADLNEDPEIPSKIAKKAVWEKYVIGRLKKDVAPPVKKSKAPAKKKAPVEDEVPAKKSKAPAKKKTLVKEAVPAKKSKAPAKKTLVVEVEKKPGAPAKKKAPAKKSKASAKKKESTAAEQVVESGEEQVDAEIVLDPSDIDEPTANSEGGEPAIGQQTANSEGGEPANGQRTAIEVDSEEEEIVVVPPKKAKAKKPAKPKKTAPPKPHLKKKTVARKIQEVPDSGQNTEASEDELLSVAEASEIEPSINEEDQQDLATEPIIIHTDEEITLSEIDDTRAGESDIETAFESKAPVSPPKLKRKLIPPPAPKRPHASKTSYTSPMRKMGLSPTVLPRATKMVVDEQPASEDIFDISPFSPKHAAQSTDDLDRILTQPAPINKSKNMRVNLMSTHSEPDEEELANLMETDPGIVTEAKKLAWDNYTTYMSEHPTYKNICSKDELFSLYESLTVKECYNDFVSSGMGHQNIKDSILNEAVWNYTKLNKMIAFIRNAGGYLGTANIVDENPVAASHTKRPPIHSKEPENAESSEQSHQPTLSEIEEKMCNSIRATFQGPKTAMTKDTPKLPQQRWEDIVDEEDDEEVKDIDFYPNVQRHHSPARMSQSKTKDRPTPKGALPPSMYSDGYRKAYHAERTTHAERTSHAERTNH